MELIKMVETALRVPSLLSFDRYLLNYWLCCDNYHVQLLFRFDNDYGALVIRGPNTYGGEMMGLFTLAVVHFQSPRFFKMVYDTPVADDVLGYLTGEEVLELLAQIQALPPRELLLEMA